MPRANSEAHANDSPHASRASRAHTPASVDTSELADEVAQATRSPIAGLIERALERIGGQAHARAVFGEAVSQGDVTVIPVARVFGAVGGGASTHDHDPDHGTGAGGAYAALPLGYIEIKNGKASFRHIDPWLPSLGGYALLARAGVGVASAVARKLRAKKKA
jgi:hypothetical protein